jgi:hypothetical protein
MVASYIETLRSSPTHDPHIAATGKSRSRVQDCLWEKRAPRYLLLRMKGERILPCVPSKRERGNLQERIMLVRDQQEEDCYWGRLLKREA